VALPFSASSLFLNFFMGIMPRDLGGYLERRRRTEIYDDG
jgi:hypothetical protein